MNSSFNGVSPDGEPLTDLTVTSQLSELSIQLNRVERQVDFLRNAVETIFNAMTEARNAPGMQGMMARNMLPDFEFSSMNGE